MTQPICVQPKEHLINNKDLQANEKLRFVLWKFMNEEKAKVENWMKIDTVCKVSNIFACDELQLSNSHYQKINVIIQAWYSSFKN